MIVGIGVDLVENRRVEQELVHGEWRIEDGIFTAAEINRAQSVRCPALYYAKCFVAKEAALKALGFVVSDLALFLEAEIIPGSDGNDPRIALSGRLKQEAERRHARHTRLAVTSSRKLSGAVVILEA